MNVLLEMALMAGTTLVLGFGSWKLYRLLTGAGVSGYVPIGIILAVMAALTAIVYRLTLSYGEKVLEELE